MDDWRDEIQEAINLWNPLSNLKMVLSPKEKLTFKEEEQFMDHICDVIVKTGQAIQLFAYGMKDWHSRHSITPFYQNVQSEAVLL